MEMRCGDCGRAAPSVCAPLLLGCSPGRRSVGAGPAERRGRGQAEAEPVCPGPRPGGGAGPRGRAACGFHPGGAFWFLCRNGTVWAQLLRPPRCRAPTACANSPGDLGAHACHPAPPGRAVGAGGPAGAGLPCSRRSPGLGEAAPRFAPPFLRQQLVSNSARTPPPILLCCVCGGGCLGSSLRMLSVRTS